MDKNKDKIKKSAKKSIDKNTQKSAPKKTKRTLDEIIKQIESQEETKKQKTVKKKSEKSLTIKEKAFCREYIQSGNGIDSVRKAGYQAKTDNCASARASILLRKDAVQVEIARLLQKREDKAIATAEDVLRFFTRCMNGEEKDQFGLDISAADRIKAAQELAKRTVDIENRIKGTPDSVVSIKVDWRKS